MNYLKETTYKDIDYSAKEMVDLLENNKIVVLRNYDINTEPLEFFNAFTDQMGYIHPIDEDLETGKPTGKRWIDITYDPEHQDRYRTAAVAQPLHTEVLFSKGGRSRISCILRQEAHDYRVNWNYYCIDKDNPKVVKQLAEEFHKFLERRVVKSGLLTEVLLHKNDVVFFHDELVLHGRNSYFATHKGQRSLNKGTLLLESRFYKNKNIINFND